MTAAETIEALRMAFLTRLTTDSETKDRRRREFNQAVFDPDGFSIFSKTDLDMVMYAFDQAATDVLRPPR